MKASAEILDRVGIGKRQEMDIKGQILHGVVMWPAKQPLKNIG